MLGCLFLPGSVSVLNSAPKILKTWASHPTITGFDYYCGYTDALIKTANSTGYFYYDMDLYHSSFSDSSSLYLIHVKGSFTAGSNASVNKDHYTENGEQKDFDKNFDLENGYIHISPKRYVDNQRTSSSFVFKAAWPQTTAQTSMVSTYYGGSVNLSKSLTAGVSVTDIAKLESTTSTGFEISTSSTVFIYGSEPSVNFNTAYSDQDTYQWAYAFEGYGKTFSLDTYLLMEVRNNGVGYQKESFGFDVSMMMDNVAWRHQPWERHYPIYLNKTETFGI